MPPPTRVRQRVEVSAQDNGDWGRVRGRRARCHRARGSLSNAFQLWQEHHGLDQLDVRVLGVPVHVGVRHQDQLPVLWWLHAWKRRKVPLQRLHKTVEGPSPTSRTRLWPNTEKQLRVARGPDVLTPELAGPSPRLPSGGWNVWTQWKYPKFLEDEEIGIIDPMGHLWDLWHYGFLWFNAVKPGNHGNHSVVLPQLLH